MNHALKITGIVVSSLLLTGILLWGLMYNLTNVFAARSIITEDAANQQQLLTATSSATARSYSFDIAGTEAVTLFIGTTFDGFGASPAIFSIEVSDVAEPAQGAARYGTTTPLTLAYGDGDTAALVLSTTTPFGFANETYATTTVSLDMRNHTHQFLRVIRTSTSASRSTSSVSIITKY